MTASQKKADKAAPETPDYGALKIVDGIPRYELEADVVRIPMDIKLGGRRHTFFSDFRPYRNSACIELLKDRQLRFVASKEVADAVDYQRPSGKLEQDFFDSHHFATFYEAEEVSAEQLETLDSRFNYRVATVNKGFLQVVTEDDEEEENEAGFWELASENAVRQKIFLAGADFRVYPVEIEHQFKGKPHAKDQLDWQRARVVREVKGAQEVNYRYELIRQLYLRMVAAPNGFLVGGKPADDGNREGWEKKLPIMPMIGALNRYFREADPKNR